MAEKLQALRKSLLEVVMDSPPKAVGTKPYISGSPDIHMLNVDQLVAYNGILERIRSRDLKMTLLKGYAGTGKTFLVAKIIQEFLAGNKMGRVCMTAPTNKAVKVQRSTASYRHTNLKYSTVHSMLALKEEITREGVQTFVRDKQRQPTVGEYDVVIVDESSMISSDLFHMLYEELSKHSTRVLFVGDPCQIPPVGQSDALPFDTEAQELYGIEVFELEQIVRQAAGNPLIAASMRIRDNLHSDTIDLGGDNMVDGLGVAELSISDPEDQKAMLNILQTHYTSLNYKEDPDYFKVLAYTNKTVDKMNDLIRGMLYGKDRGMVEIGERLVANKPIMRGGTIQFNTSDEFKVEGFTVKEDQIARTEWKIKYYETVVEHDEKNGETHSVIWVIHEDSREEFDNILKALVAKAKAQPRGTALAGIAWREFFDFQRRYADVKYNYCLTSHKCQGSTYQNAMVMVYDIATCRKVEERNRILYTACTRPAKKLIAVGW